LVYAKRITNKCLESQYLFWYDSFIPVLFFFESVFFFIYLFFLWCWGLNSGPAPGVTPPALFCGEFFEIGSLELLSPAGFKL
jgi:hypothetical protein